MRIEKVFTIAFLIGLLFKFLQVPGDQIILVISLTVIGMLYFPGGFYFLCDRILRRQNLALSIVSGFLLCTIPIGVLFKLQYWPLAQQYLSTGVIVAPILLVICYILKLKGKPELHTYYRNMVLRTSILTIMALIFYLVKTETIIKIEFRDDPELVRLATLHFTNPGNEQYKMQHYEYMVKKGYMTKNPLIKEKPDTSK